MLDVLDSENVELYAISVDNEDAIPAVEQDATSNQYHVLVFTDENLAKKYCYLKKPEFMDRIYILDRHYREDKLVQTGLIRIARVCLNRYPQVTGVIFDHPGVLGQIVHVANMRDIAATATRAISKQRAHSEDLVSYLANLNKEEYGE